MEIQQITIEQFGKFRDTKLTFGPGMNVIYGANEAGKSTICAFLLAMFYGMPNDSKKKSTRENVRARYMPWGEEKMAGSVAFTHAGKSYVIERRMGDVRRKDKVTVRDGATWEEVVIPDKEEAGRYFFGIGPEAFRKTLYTGQLASVISPDKEDEVLDRLANLRQTGEEDVSYQRASSQLTSLLNSLRSVSGRAGRMPALEEEIASLRAEEERSRSVLAQHREDLARVGMLAEDSARLSAELAALEAQRAQSVRQGQYAEYRRLKDELATLTSRLQPDKLEAPNRKLAEVREAMEREKRFSDGSRADYERACQLRRREADLARQLSEEETHWEALRALEKERDSIPDIKGVNLPMLVLGLLVMVIGVVCGVVLHPILFAVFAVGIFLVAVSCLSIREQQEAQQKRRTLEAMIAEKRKTVDALGRDKLVSEREETQAELNDLLEVYQVKTEQEILDGLARRESLEKEGTALEREIALISEQQEAVKKDIDRVTAHLASFPFTEETREDDEQVLPLTELNAQITAKNQEILACETARREIAYELAHRLDGVRLPAEIAEERERKEEELADLGEKYEALSLALAAFAHGYETLKQDFAPVLSEHVGAILRRMSGGKYADVRVNDRFELCLKPADGGPLVDAAYVSGGTYDMIYLALRLGIIQTVLGVNVPLLVLDDSFSEYDDARTKAAVNLLGEVFPGVQVLYFTCHASFLSIAEGAHVVRLA